MALPKKNSINNQDKWINRNNETGYFTNFEVELVKNLRIDNKKRINLGKLAAAEVTSYDAEVKENGVIILHPKVEIPAEELWLWQNKEAMASVQRGIEDAAKGNLVELEENFWDFLKEE